MARHPMYLWTETQLQKTARGWYYVLGWANQVDRESTEPVLTYLNFELPGVSSFQPRRTDKVKMKANLTYFEVQVFET